MKELICIDQHILSFSNLLDRYSNEVRFEDIVYLNLHNNEIKDINALSLLLQEKQKNEENMENMENNILIFNKLEILDISSNQIQSLGMTGFQYLANLRKLNLSTNQVEEIKKDHFANLFQLETLNLNYNSIKTLNGLQVFQDSSRYRLKSLSLIGNQVEDLNELQYLNKTSLQTLNFETKFKKLSNPICKDNAYIETIFEQFTSLRVFDQKRVSNKISDDSTTSSLPLSPSISPISQHSRLDENRMMIGDISDDDDDNEKENRNISQQRPRSRSSDNFFKKFNQLNSELENLRVLFDDNKRTPAKNIPVKPVDQTNQKSQIQPEPEPQQQPSPQVPPRHSKSSIRKTRSTLKNRSTSELLETDKFYINRIKTLKKKHRLETTDIRDDYYKLVYEMGKLKSFVKFLETKSSEQNLTIKQLQVRVSSEKRKNLNQLKNFKDFTGKMRSISHKVKTLKANNRELSNHLSRNVFSVTNLEKVYNIRRFKSLFLQIRAAKTEVEKTRIFYIREKEKLFSIFEKSMMRLLHQFLSHQKNQKKKQSQQQERRSFFRTREILQKLRDLRTQQKTLRNEVLEIQKTQTGDILTKNIEMICSQIHKYYTSKLSHMEAETQKKESNFERLKQLVTEKIEREIEHEKRMKQTEKTSMEIKTQNNFLLLENRKYIRVNTVLKTKYHKLGELHRDLEQKKREVETELHELSKQIDRKNLTVERLEDERIHYIPKTELVQHETTIRQLEAKIVSKNQVIEELATDTTNLRTSNESLEKEKRLLKENTRSVLRELETELGKKNERIRTLMQKITKMKMEDETKRKKFVQVVREKEAIQKQKDQSEKILQEEKVELERKSEILKTFLENHERELEQLKERQKEMREEEEFYSLERDYADLKKEKREMEEKVEYLEEKVTQATDRFGRCRGENKKLKIENNLLLQNLERKDGHVRSLLQKISKLKSMI